MECRQECAAVEEKLRSFTDFLILRQVPKLLKRFEDLVEVRRSREFMDPAAPCLKEEPVHAPHSFLSEFGILERFAKQKQVCEIHDGNVGVIRPRFAPQTFWRCVFQDLLDQITAVFRKDLAMRPAENEPFHDEFCRIAVLHVLLTPVPAKVPLKRRVRRQDLHRADPLCYFCRPFQWVDPLGRILDSEFRILAEKLLDAH